MPGTIHAVNTALSRPLLIAGCEKRLAIVNALVSFTLVGATYLHFPTCLMGVGFYFVLHAGLMVLAKVDPFIGVVFQRAQRYLNRPLYLARSSIGFKTQRAVFSLPR